MGPIEYINRFRMVATISWLGLLVAAIVLMLLWIIPRSPIIPLIALGAGSIPIIIFKLFNKVECPRCKHKMKVTSGFPHIIYKCTRCAHVVNTNVDSG